MIDGHVHLNEIEAIDQAMERARAVGIRGIIAVGIDQISNQTTLALLSVFMVSSTPPSATIHGL
jgi:Tat protein secretion system quality control protein TatD with DNase activity